MTDAITITAERIRLFAPQSAYLIWGPSLDAAARKFEINTPRRIQHWLGQLHHESGGFTRLRENLQYSAARLCEVWPRRFPTPDSTAGFAYNPEALAEKVYGGRADLGNETAGDGARYIGRGPLQITGRANYAAAEDGTGLPLLERPDLAETPTGGSQVAGWFWQAHGLNELADQDDIGGITKRINGGFIGLPERERQVSRAKMIFR